MMIIFVIQLSDLKLFNATKNFKCDIWLNRTAETLYVIRTAETLYILMTFIKAFLCTLF